MISPELIDRAKTQQPDLKLTPIISRNTIHVGEDLNSISIPIHFLLECPDCENGTCDSCPLHHTWKRMSNKKGLLDQPSKHFTSVPIPYHWRVQKSSILGAGLGLFARTHVPCGTRMGPYRGESKVFSGRVHSHNDMCYAWEIKSKGKVVKIVDGKDPKKSNFMRYINCACFESQQNMVAYQHNGQIFYRSVKDIAVGEELLVWYGHEYGKELGLLNSSMNMSLGPLTKGDKPSRQKPLKNGLRTGASVHPSKRRSQRRNQKSASLARAESSEDSDEDASFLPPANITSTPASKTLLTTQPQNSGRRGQKRPTSNSVAPPVSKRTNPPLSPSLTEDGEPQSYNLRNAPSHENRSSIHVTQVLPLAPSTSVQLEEADSSNNENTSRTLRSPIQSTDTQPTMRSQTKEAGSSKKGNTSQTVGNPIQSADTQPTKRSRTEEAGSSEKGNTSQTVKSPIQSADTQPTKRSRTEEARSSKKGNTSQTVKSPIQSADTQPTKRSRTEEARSSKKGNTSQTMRSPIQSADTQPTKRSRTEEAGSSKKGNTSQTVKGPIQSADTQPTKRSRTEEAGSSEKGNTSQTVKGPIQSADTQPTKRSRAEEAGSSEKGNTSQTMRSPMQSADTQQPTKRSRTSVSPSAFQVCSNLVAPISRKPDAETQPSWKSPDSMFQSPLQHSLSLLLASNDKPFTHPATHASGNTILRGGRSEKRNHRSSRMKPQIVSQQRLMNPAPEALHPSVPYSQESLLSPAPPSLQTLKKTLHMTTTCVAPNLVPVGTGTNFCLPHSQATAATALSSSISSRSTWKSSVAASSADVKCHVSADTASSLRPPQVSSLAVEGIKQEPLTSDPPPSLTPSQLVVDSIHDSDVFLIIQPQSGPPTPAISYYCRVCNGHLVLTDVGHWSHSHAPQTDCSSESPGNVKKAMKIPCVFCGALLSSRGALYAHIKTTHRHKGGKYPYYCEICRKGYRSSFSLWGHLRVHLDVGPQRGCCIKQKLPPATTMAKKEFELQSCPFALGRPDPCPSYPVPTTVETFCQSEDETEIVSVGSQEFPSGPEMTEDYTPVQKMPQWLHPKGSKAGRTTK